MVPPCRVASPHNDRTPHTSLHRGREEVGVHLCVHVRVPQTKSDRREGDASRARRGDVFTGSLVFTEKQAYVDLGFNTFLPLTDVRSGAVLLRTSRWMDVEG